MNLKKGDKVYLKTKEDFEKEFSDRVNSTGESYVFDTLDLNVYQLEVICPEIKYEVLSIDSDGDLKFYNLPGTYPAEIVKG